MKVAGFTFIRNAILLDYPVAEAITSVLPLCDRFFVAVGHSDDTSKELISSVSPEKMAVIDTVWNESLISGGAVYAEETNKAFDSIPAEYDWCFYIQGDEVLHEQYLPIVRKAMGDNLERKEVEGLLFGFRHFYGTYDFVGDSRKWYRREIRIIRNDKSIRSYRDAQGFRKRGKKLSVMPVDAEIYHYGWVRHPNFMQRKVEVVRQFYGGSPASKDVTYFTGQKFDYAGHYDALARFTGSHPKVMQKRIARLNWEMAVDLKKRNMNLRYQFLYWFEKITGIRPFEFRNYTLIKSTGKRR